MGDLRNLVGPLTLDIGTDLAEAASEDLAGYALARRAEAVADVVELGRTHLQDVMPLTLGQDANPYHVLDAEGIVVLSTGCATRAASFSRAMRQREGFAAITLNPLAMDVIGSAEG